MYCNLGWIKNYYLIDPVIYFIIFVFQIVAGEWNLFKDDGTEQPRRVVKIILHEKYNQHNVNNDISLLKVDSPLEFNDFVKGVTLPEQLQEFTGEAQVTGWGTLTEGGVSPATLQKVTVPVVSDDDCRASYGTLSIIDSMICAGEAGKDSCQGDSGGPMTCGEFLCGIVSWGKGCAEAGYPGVYTEVSYFVDWILANAA
jgi:secreted trypsin-like serine protease